MPGKRGGMTERNPTEDEAAGRGNAELLENSSKMTGTRCTPEKYQLLPDLPPEQYEALKADIGERGVMVPVDVDEFGVILDGHHRARACRELGINDYPVSVRSGLSEEEKRSFARKANVLRRHLTREQVRELIGAQLRDAPEWSDRQVAKAIGVDHKTVGSVRSDLRSSGEIPQLAKLLGADGKRRSAGRASKPRRKQAQQALHDGDVDLDDDDDDAEAEQSDAPLETKAAQERARKREEREKKRNDKEWAQWAGGPEKRAKMEHAMDLIRMGADPDGEKVMSLLREACVCVVEDRSYNPVAGRSEAEIVEWNLFIMFLSFDEDTRDGGEPWCVAEHVEYLLQRPFQNVPEWLGPEGDRWRRLYDGRPVSEKFKSDWAAFLDAHRAWSLAQVVNAIETLQQRFEQARTDGRFKDLRKVRVA
jgi:ParB-like chromosome segregation protein Spo0J